MNEELTLVAILVGIAHSGIRLATPYLYAAIGETFAQRSGVLNLGVEGMMLMGAFSGFYVVFQTGDLTNSYDLLSWSTPSHPTKQSI